MDLGNLRTGERIAAIAAIVLFIVMFFGWFGIDVEGAADLSQEETIELAEAFPDAEADGDSISFSAWESMSFIDIVLFLAILAALGLAALTATARTVDLPVAASAITAGLGILATLLVLYRLIDPPYALGREFWAFVGLLAAAGIAYGGWRAMQEEGTSFGEQRDRVGGGPPPPPPPAEPPSSTQPPPA